MVVIPQRSRADDDRAALLRYKGGFIMEAKKEDKTCALKLKCVKGQTESGRDVYTMLTFSHVNPEVADGDMFEVAGLIGRLQEMTVADVVRADSASLVAE
ncbi:DUF1659 domain-containing protein, partial [Selenomonas sp.]|uniref:DUF1659 domain-containing protein n=2 Tax=Selenomonas sp. TaxID=2053611 RepID=UPI0025E6115A